MNTNFCKNCDNFMFTYVDSDTQEIYNGCKVCSYMESNSNMSFVYKSETDLDISNIISDNKNIVNDLTLPKIKDNPNIKCINKDCKSGENSSITYIKYDSKKMLYLYSCDICGQKWKST